MAKNYYIQRTGEKARDIKHFFQIYADLGVLPYRNALNIIIIPAPTSAKQGEVYVDSDTYNVCVWVDNAWSYTPLIADAKIYDARTEQSKIFTGSAFEVDYFYDEGITVVKTDSIVALPERKETYKEDWKDEQGEDTFLPNNTYFQAKEVEIEFFIKNLSKSKMRINTDLFLKYVTAKGFVNYFDTFKCHGFRGYYKGHKVSEERYKDGLYWQKFSITFVVNRLCYGYDTTSCGVLVVDINEEMEGQYELHLSNGEYGVFDSDSYVASADSKFIIVVPQFLDLVSITCGQPGPIGVQSGGDFGVGFTLLGQDYLIGI